MFEHCGKRVLALFLAMVMFFTALVNKLERRLRSSER